MTHPSKTLGPALEPLIGRERERAGALALLQSGARLLSFTGPGGAGKSSLAREVGRHLAPPVMLCELGDVTTAEGLVAAVARGAGLAASAARGPRAHAIETLARRLVAAAPLVLVLDDADGVVAEAAALVRATLEGGEGVRFLVTSREALGLEGERVQVVGSLAPEAALALFEARAGGARGAWSESDVATLAEHLDGLPLGIEIAARRSKLVPPGDLLHRLEERFRLLKSDRRDALARHSTLAATIEWSLSRLDPDEALAFTALGAFEGSFAVEAFEAVVGPALTGDALDAAEALVRKSLLLPLDHHGSARLTMLRTLRAFARERLSASDPGILRHAEFYVQHAERSAARAYGPEAEEAIASIEVDLPNLLRAFESQRTSRPDLAARAVAAVGDVAILRNDLDLRSALFRQAREAADVHGDPALRVRTRLVEAKVLLELASASEADALLVAALAIAEEAKLDDAADVKRSLAWARIAQGQAESALALLEEALVAHHAQKNVRGEADALAARGLTRCLRGELAAGHADLENAYALHVMASDAIRREKVREMANVVGLSLADLGGDGAASSDEDASVEQQIARLREEAASHRASGRPWREAVVRFRLAALENADASAAGEAAAPSSAGASAGWAVGPDARWLRTPEGEEIDLARHGALRKVLDVLVSRRLEAPGSASSAIALLAEGWPDERVRHESGMLRVYSVVRRLRALGLGDALVTRDDGYLLDPGVTFARDPRASTGS